MTASEWIKRKLRDIGCDRFFGKVYLRLQASKRGLKLVWLDQESPPAIGIQSKKRMLLCSSFHYVYAWDLIRDFDYYFDAVVPMDRNGFSVVDYSKPGLHKLSKSKIEFLFTSLAESEKSTDIYLKFARLNKGDVVFDCGAYCGASSHAFSQAVGADGKVLAFEPDPQNFRALQSNLERHQLSNVTAIPMGIWSACGEFEFEAEGSLGSALASVIDRKVSLCKVTCITLEEAVRKYSIERLDFVKLDIEGAEVEALLAAKEILLSLKPKMIIEPHVIQGVLNVGAVLDVLHQIGCQTKLIEQDSLSLPLIFAERSR
jgi:FkbM family methyltransferase